MYKRRLENISLGNVRLRLLEEEDLPLTFTWRNRDDIRIWFFHSEPITIKNHYAWFNKYKSLDDDYVFIIEFMDKPVGQVALYHIDWQKQSAEYGRLMIGEDKAKGKGIAKIATDLIIEFGFYTLNLKEIYLEVKKQNINAIKLYERCGFSHIEERQDSLLMKKVNL